VYKTLIDENIQNLKYRLYLPIIPKITKSNFSPSNIPGKETCGHRRAISKTARNENNLFCYSFPGQFFSVNIFVDTHSESYVKASGNNTGTQKAYFYATRVRRKRNIGNLKQMIGSFWLSTVQGSYVA
jgi:hypothetical protein